MKIIQKITYNGISCTEERIEDTYFVQQSAETGKFFIISENGYNGYGISEFNDIESALKEVKKIIKNYFIDRGENNPKNW